jgi:methionyl-tRNA formyltransferase
MRVCFFGTPEFAVPTLDALVQAGHEVVAVVAQPDRPSGRGQHKTTPPVAVRARALGLDLRQPTALKSGPFVEWFKQQDIDVAVVVAFGRILPPAFLDGPRAGCINVHASLLPRYRGAAPIQWCLIRGEEETGCVTMKLEDGLDTGPLYLTERTPVMPDETAGELFVRLAPIGARLLIETLERLPHIEPKPQDDENATLAPPLHKDDGRIDWSRPAKQVHDLVRGTNPWPGAHTTLRGERLKIHRTRVVDGRGEPGTILGGALVAAGNGAVELVEVQLAGRKRQPGRDLVNGARITPGERFGAMLQEVTAEPSSEEPPSEDGMP